MEAVYQWQWHFLCAALVAPSREDEARRTDRPTVGPTGRRTGRTYDRLNFLSLLSRNKTIEIGPQHLRIFAKGESGGG